MTVSGPGFPPASAALVRGHAAEDEVRAFLGALAPWHEHAMGWLDERAATGEVSPALRDVLRWALGSRDAPAPHLPVYDVRRFPPPAGSDAEHALDVLAWRAGVVDFLSDAWDTLGPADFGLEECALALEELFVPAALRGVAACPDCLQPLPARPREAAAHVLACPIRARRAQAGGRALPPGPF